MRRSAAGLALVVAALATVPAGCTAVDAAVHEPYPAVEIVDGADDKAPKTLTLTEDAVRRLELVTVAAAADAVPYSAVVYDKTGAPWVYTNPQERTFIRVPVVIERVEGDTAVLSDGPAAGTRVVSRAVIKLYGAENGVGGGH